MANSASGTRLGAWLELVRWHKPSGRLILLIPAGWSLWLTPNAPPAPLLVGLIVLGGLAVSAAGCIANDLWDRRIDPLVERTRNRPLADGRVGVREALALLLLALVVALTVLLVLMLGLPASGRSLCLLLALAALPPVLLYPSAKRWFGYPQLVLALCWGFAVLIPWAARTGSLAGGWPLALVWLATLLWTFGFDTVYAMADRDDDRAIGVRSSALSLGPQAPLAVAVSYGLAAAALALAAGLQGVGLQGIGLQGSGWIVWPLWLLAAFGMQREAALLRRPALPRSAYGRHFSRQVQLGGLLLLALVLGQLP
ncbi:4-hydroxybenzoate polyprenyltransferase [Synechococcus sp. 8F6]|uniref:4-hydroxybenzoate polyprenyltransferase n=1 Tax=Synechococcus sp. 8F6 TaxID=2025606 RepID=UPI000B99CDA9|nr:4-hydroxybenzoate polyprenyltransferase [Synechococcus sp. 8F6]